MSVEEAESICSGVRTSMKLNSIPIEGAARLETVDCCCMVCGGGIPENRDPRNARHRVFSSSSRFALNSASIIGSPMAFPPGRARLVTRRQPSGSATMAYMRRLCALTGDEFPLRPKRHGALTVRAVSRSIMLSLC